MSGTTVITLAQREISDALRNRWFIAYAGAFVVLSVALATLIDSSAGYSGVSGFGRTSAGLINLVLFLAPLMGLTLGAQAMTSEREVGTLSYLLAQPVSLFEVFISKFIGLAIAISAAIMTGFALATLTISYMSGGQGMTIFLRLTGLTILLALVALAIGYLVSSVAHRTATALGVAIVIWLALVMIGDLGLMGAAIMVKLSPTTLLGIAILNPLESYRIAAISLLRDSLELLGPAGLVANDRFGDSTIWILTAIMVAWLVASLVIAYLALARKEQR
jgi:Cu-processing system permease protein